MHRDVSFQSYSWLLKALAYCSGPTVRTVRPFANLKEFKD
jgi:hypothetical protein